VCAACLRVRTYAAGTAHTRGGHESRFRIYVRTTAATFCITRNVVIVIIRLITTTATTHARGTRAAAEMPRKDGGGESGIRRDGDRSDNGIVLIVNQ